MCCMAHICCMVILHVQQRPCSQITAICMHDCISHASAPEVNSTMCMGCPALCTLSGVLPSYPCMHTLLPSACTHLHLASMLACMQAHGGPGCSCTAWRGACTGCTADARETGGRGQGAAGGLRWPGGLCVLRCSSSAIKRMGKGRPWVGSKSGVQDQCNPVTHNSPELCNLFPVSSL